MKRAKDIPLEETILVNHPEYFPARAFMFISSLAEFLGKILYPQI
jgi:hypothetical protein